MTISPSTALASSSSFEFDAAQPRDTIPASPTQKRSMAGDPVSHMDATRYHLHGLADRAVLFDSDGRFMLKMMDGRPDRSAASVILLTT